MKTSIQDPSLRARLLEENTREVVLMDSRSKFKLIYNHEGLEPTQKIELLRGEGLISEDQEPQLRGWLVKGIKR